MNISFIEHQQYPYEKLKLSGIDIATFPDKSNKELYLGLTSNCRYQTVHANYYIGLAWLKEKEVSISVMPKMDIDYLRMFMSCFHNDDEDVQSKLMQIYSIDFDKPCIQLNSISFELTPFIIIHFLQLVRKIINKGLKKDYILHEENLKGKVKGKIKFSQQFTKNITVGKSNNNYCQYQEYSENCTENQILKKTLYFVEHYLNNHELSCLADLQMILKGLLPQFRNVADIVSIQEIKQFRVNPLYKEYARALKVARLILRRFSYDIDSTKKYTDELLPPFLIDMPLLYELYVLSLLREKFGKKVFYHIATYKDEIDFGKRDEVLIMDAKYVPAWEEEVKSEHVGQLSRYARSLNIRKKLLGRDDNQSICNCLLLYPNEKGIEKFEEEEILKEEKVESIGYLQFYKLGIRLPQRK